MIHTLTIDHKNNLMDLLPRKKNGEKEKKEKSVVDNRADVSLLPYIYIVVVVKNNMYYLDDWHSIQEQKDSSSAVCIALEVTRLKKTGHLTNKISFPP